VDKNHAILLNPPISKIKRFFREAIGDMEKLIVLDSKNIKMLRGVGEKVKSEDYKTLTRRRKSG